MYSVLPCDVFYVSAVQSPICWSCSGPRCCFIPIPRGL